MKRNFWKRLGKRVGVIALAAGAAFMLAACSNSSSSGKDVKITILQGKVENNKQFKQIAKEYEKTHPNVTIEVTSIGGGTQYDPVLKTRISSGNAPTIFSLAGPADVKQFKAHEADLSDTKAAKAAKPGTLDAVKNDQGKAVGLPFNVEGYGLVYNKKVFEKAGIDPNSLTSMDKLEAAIKQLDSQKSELGIKGVFATPGKEAWVFSDHLANLYLAQDYNGNAQTLYKSKKMAFSKANDMKTMIDLEKDYSIKPIMQLDYSAQVNQYFSQGKVAMIQQGDWIYPTVEGIDKNFAKNDIGMIPIPVPGEEGKMPVGTSLYWAVNSKKSTAEQKAAKDFLDWMYTSKAGKKDVVEKLHYVPAYKGYDNYKMSDPLTSAVFEYSKANKTTGWVFPGYTGTSWDPDVAQPNLQKYLSGKQSWDKTVQNMKDGWAKQQKSSN
ncbi:ABC transporter substrate-binding protein [Companilactobacillus nuruki]|uniref:Sugar ABC transporter substrate-binding protein n=1 Tax=Companilactobacillus nuruki TaxID=1993540 RepID=A0A2N7AVR3_9LACO|nr:extracellular solute-binding protein [Companilactobacillus nuruki]PMD72259.1 sugar ABC transporter substrate-binding protein [Companilactobacillus nuruki]